MRYLVTETISQLDELWRATGAPPLAVADEVVTGRELGTGGFGSVHTCAIPGVPATAPAVLKVFADSGAAEPHARSVAELHEALRHLPSPDWPRRSRGVPHWVGRVRGPSGETRVACLVMDLDAAGFRSMTELREDALWSRWSALTVDDRVALAGSFVSAYQVLESVSFVHADINAENVFVNLETLDAAIIDVDAGVLSPGPGRTPRTGGKPGEFLAPEVLGPSGVSDPARVDAAAERWAIGQVVSSLLFGTNPLFFLRNLGHDVVRAYVSQHVWPEIPFTSSLYLLGSDRYYRRWRAGLEELPPALLDVFRDFVHPGYGTPARRPAAPDWLEVLRPAPPEFEVVVADAVVVAGGSALVTWSAPHAREVEVAGTRGLPPRGALAVPMPATGRLRLVARNRWGDVERYTDVVLVVRVPPVRLPTLVTRVPRAPEVPRFRVPEAAFAPSAGGERPSGAEPWIRWPAAVRLCRVRSAGPRFR